MPAILILTGQLYIPHLYQQPELNDDTKIIPNISGYINDDICLEWPGYFNQHTAKLAKGLKTPLILNDHESNQNVEFIKYCKDHGIIAFGTPLSLTYLLHAPDVGFFFQPLKYYHAKVIGIMVGNCPTIANKIEFLTCIQEIRRQAFKVDTIKYFFDGTGIWPFMSWPRACWTSKPLPEQMAACLKIFYFLFFTLGLIFSVGNEQPAKDPEFQNVMP